MIRELEKTELDKLCDGAKEWFSSSQILGRFNIEQFKKTWENILDKQIGVIIAAFENDIVQGAIGGIFHPDINTGENTSSEFFWYVKKDSRGSGVRLLKAFEEWSKKQNCKKIRMTQLLEGSDGVEKVYRRFNYYPVEVTFVKEI